jgi:MFS family permease
MQPAWPTPGRAWWTVAVLTFAYIISFVDRTILSLLAQPIRIDLSLNDTQMGLLAGPAFGLFYAVMGLPLGWVADRASRRGLIAVGAALWCAATAACGLAGTFLQLLLLAIVAIVIAPLTSLLALSTRAPFARLVGRQATA